MKPNTVVVGWPNNWRKREDDGTRVNIADYMLLLMDEMMMMMTVIMMMMMK